MEAGSEAITKFTFQEASPAPRCQNGPSDKPGLLWLRTVSWSQRRQPTCLLTPGSRGAGKRGPGPRSPPHVCTETAGHRLVSEPKPFRGGKKNLTLTGELVGCVRKADVWPAMLQAS